MKYLNSYKKIYENKQDIDSICERYGITNYTINSDGSVDIDGDVHLYSKNLSKLPLNFNIVSGNFNCSHNQLTSLEHCPSEIGGDFSCHNNKLTSLEHCPSEVGGGFYCSYNELTSLEYCSQQIGGNFYCTGNELTSLEHCPQQVGGDFYCGTNQITSLEYCPSEIGGDFSCSYNLITSLEHCPQQVDGDFYCVDNPVYTIVRGFIRSDNKNELIELFNDTDIIQDDDVVIYDRLVWFFEEIDMESPDIHEIAKHYKIIR